MTFAFNPLDKQTNITLSNGNKTAAHTGSIDSWAGVRSVDYKSSGKWYFELHIDQLTGANLSVGWADSSHALNKRVGGDGGGVGVGWQHSPSRVYRDSSYISFTCTGLAQDDYAMVAVDLDTGKFWFGFNGSWCSSGDPANGTNEAYLETEVVGINMYPMVSFYRHDDHIGTIRTLASEFEGTIPTGFSAPDAPSGVQISLAPFIEIDSLSLGVSADEVISLAPFVEIESFSLDISAGEVISLAPFVEIESLSLGIGAGEVISLAPFIEIDSLSLGVRVSEIISLAPFVEIESLSADAKVFLKKLWALVNSINVGRNFLASSNFAVQKTVVMRNSLSETLNKSWAIKNTLSEGTINASWAIKNELVDVDTVSKDWALKNTIGDYTPGDGPFSFWGQGPVVHRVGSLGGYE